jgi:tRNA dimethylallyltransferase
MNKVIILLGPTGVGKTGISLLLAKTLNTEIISADSMQIYRHMDIGTAKPTPAERKYVPHHMIDIAEPWESYSTGRYIAAVKLIIEQLLTEGKIPVVVGGTGLYIRAMTKGIFSGPSADWSLREELLTLEQEAKGTLYDYLKTLDPATAARITLNDTRRLIRALEVCVKGGAKMSEFQKTLTQPLPYEFIKIGITRERKELYRLIEERVDAMITAGLVEEVKKVTGMMKQAITPGPSNREKDYMATSSSPPLLLSSLPSLQAIGYKEIGQYFRDEITLSEAVSLIKKSSRRYAKRQFTWFRKEENTHWVDVTGITEPQEIFDKIYSILSKMIQIGTVRQPCNIEKNTLC